MASRPTGRSPPTSATTSPPAGSAPAPAARPNANSLGRYKVARATARAAIRLLRDEGLLITQQGRGTFVHACRPDIPNTQASKGIYPAIRYTASTINDDALDALYKELALLRHLAATRGAHAPLSAVA
ncbi:hypothetical protein GCM10020000_86400 [Streptomyces olivoverticillatus]